MNSAIPPLGTVRGAVDVPPVLLSRFHVHAGALIRLSLVALTMTVVAPASVMALGSYLMLSPL